MVNNEFGEEKRERKQAWDGKDMERKGDPKLGWPQEWDDSWDSVINTNLSIQNIQVGDNVEVWYRGFWWRASIYRVARATSTVTVRWQHNLQRTSGYKISLVRKWPLG